MTRYLSIEEVDSALKQLEENERTGAADKANSEKHSDNENPLSRTSSNAISMNGQGVGNGRNDENGLHENLGDSETDSGTSTFDHEGREEEELDEENVDDVGDTDEDDDGDDGGEPGSDEDDEVHVRQKMADVDPFEASRFEQELRAVVQESMEQRKQELRGRPALNMVIPLNVFEGSNKDHHHGRGVSGESGDTALDEEAGESKEVQVKVLVKRGNKQQTKQMLIPKDCSLIQITRQKEAAELEERQDIKRLVLEYNDREEEEINGLGTHTSNWMPSGGSRVAHRGGSGWEGNSGRGSSSRHRHQHHTGSGFYHGRRR